MEQIREAIYAFIADGDNDGVVAVSQESLLGTIIMPLVTSGRPTVMEHMRQIATTVATETGKTIRLYKFTHGEVIDIFGGPGTQQ